MTRHQRETVFLPASPENRKFLSVEGEVHYCPRGLVPVMELDPGWSGTAHQGIRGGELGATRRRQPKASLLVSS